MTSISRRIFLTRAALAAAGTAWLAACNQKPVLLSETPRESSPPTSVQPDPTHIPSQSQPSASAGSAYLSVVHGPNVAVITKAAVDAIGGMGQFVKPGFDVIIKPNICTNYYPPEYAVTTNPAVVAALVNMALNAGARRVRVMDTGFGGTPESAYKISGIGPAVMAAGGEMAVMSPVKFLNTKIPQGKDIKEWKIYEDILKADVVINVPIAKHHSMARLTLSSKNLLGVIAKPGGIHLNMGQRIADLLSLIRPHLTVIDAVRILMANGPTGGNLDDVKQMDTVIASADGVAADAFATSLFGLQPDKIAYIQKAAEMGLGKMDLAEVKIDEFSL